MTNGVKARLVVEIPEDRVDRLLSAYRSNDPVLLQYLSAPAPTELREVHAGRVDAQLTRLESPLRTVDNICAHFPRAVKALQRRHENRQSVVVSDEFDVQDFLETLLSVSFSDIRREEWVPSYAGVHARADFLLKRERLFIEVKVVTTNLRERQLHDQLLVDLAHYRKHPDCKTLVCFVYDPLGLLRNPVGLEDDLRCHEDDFTVHVRVAPRGL